MPPTLQAYVLTRRRDTATIDQFITDFVDRAASEDRGDEELMLISLSEGSTAVKHGNYEWEPAASLAHVIERGLSDPPRAFFVHLKPQNPTIDHVVLSFTSDDQLVLGLGIDDEGQKPENMTKAKDLLHDLARRFNGHIGLIVVEQAPPSNEKEFREAARHSMTEYFIEHND